MKKVLIFLPSLAGGGAERTVVNIMNHLDKNKFSITLVMVCKDLNDENKHEYLDNVNKDVKILYLDCRLSKYHFMNIIIKLARTIKRENPDLVFSTTLNANLISILASKLSRKKPPVIIRETTNRTQLGGGNINKYLTKLLYNKADKIVSLSKGVKEDLVGNFQIDENRIEVIYNPVDISYINKNSLERIKDLNLPGNCKVMITVGRLIEAKDQETMLKAFKIISDQISAKLLILGKGPKEEELKALCNTLGIERNVLFVGFEKNPYKYMNFADLFILSSKREGFGHVLVEAMALGTPVVSTDCNSGPREIIEENKYGELVEVGDYKQLAQASINILNDEKKQNELSLLGKMRAKDFKADIIVRYYEDLFMKVIG